VPDTTNVVSLNPIQSVPVTTNVVSLNPIQSVPVTTNVVSLNPVQSLNQCLSPLKLWVWIPPVVRCTRLNIMWSSLSVTCRRSVVFLWVLRFPPSIKLTTSIKQKYYWKWH
jgi:hypothetical protein